jgi:NTE family protein
MKCLGLVLGGGGARGLAHIGVLKVLEEAGIPVGCLCGTSMGGVIAAGYAAGLSPAELETQAIRMSRKRELVRLVDITPPRRGLLAGSQVRAFLSSLIGEHLTFADLRCPLALCAVDLVTARPVALCEGRLMPAVVATMSIPGLFPPVQMGESRLVDGGVLNNLPVDLARQMCADVVLAVDVQFNPLNELPWQDLPEKHHFPVPTPGFFQDLYRAELIMIAELTQARLLLTPPDLLVRPAIPPDVTLFLGFLRAPEIIQAGEQAAREALPQIVSLLVEAED